MFLCAITVISSQIDFRLNTQLKIYASDKDKDSQDVAQVVHLTTAIFLAIMGSIFEYTPKADKIILGISMLVGLAKLATGLYLLIEQDDLKKRDFD